MGKIKGEEKRKAIIASRYELLEVKVNVYYGFKKEPNMQYPNVIFQREALSKEQVDEMVASGWTEMGYDRYMDYYHMKKVGDIRNNIKNIVIYFNKMTTEEDKAMFGFSDEYLMGSYTYEVPDEMREEIAKILFASNGSLDEDSSNTIFNYFSQVFLTDEFNALHKMKCEYEQSLKSLSREPGESESEVEEKLNEQYRNIFKNNPADCNYMNSRAWIIKTSYYDRATEKLGLKKKAKRNKRKNGILLKRLKECL